MKFATLAAIMTTASAVSLTTEAEADNEKYILASDFLDEAVAVLCGLK